MALLTALAVGALVERAWIASAILAAGAGLVGLRSLQECGIAMARLRGGIDKVRAVDG